MRLVQIGLVNKTAKGGDNDKRVSETIDSAIVALNIQITKHLRKCWNAVPEAVVRRVDPKDNPKGVWLVELVDELKGGEGGFHSTDHFQPFAGVDASDPEWTIAASHEVLEMLVDPSGQRLQPAQAIKCDGHKIEDDAGEFVYLLEVCDPCEAKTFAYKIDSTWVSDFVTPDFYSCMGVPDARYSFRHNIAKPRNLLPGGYITWVETKNDKDQTKIIQQIIWHDEKQGMQQINRGPISDLPPGNGALGRANLRSYIDAETRSSHPQRHRGNVVSRLYKERTPLHLNTVLGRTPLDKPHWVTYHQDCVLERKIYKNPGDKNPVATCIEFAKAHEPIFRPKDPHNAEHVVTNISCTPCPGSPPIVPFDKDLIGPEERHAWAARRGRTKI